MKKHALQKKRDGKAREREKEITLTHSLRSRFLALLDSPPHRLSKAPIFSKFPRLISLLEDLALDVLEAVDRRLLGEHVLDALLLRGVVDVDLGPVVEVEVVALLVEDFFF